MELKIVTINTKANKRANILNLKQQLLRKGMAAGDVDVLIDKVRKQGLNSLRQYYKVVDVAALEKHSESRH